MLSAVAVAASLPSIAVAVVISLNVTRPSLRTALIAGVALLALNVLSRSR